METEDLLTALVSFSADPLGFVYFAFPWGEGELEKETGPEGWQIQILDDLRNGLISATEAIQLARTSGHGIGKSALVAWIILWAIGTAEDTKGVVTANTENQLKTKTWAEVAKWFRLFVGKELFKLTATALFSADPEHERTWRIDMVPWSERNTEAFAGLHNLGKRIIIVFDEASAIPDLIWEVVEGALTDEGTEIIWCAFGNPTRSKGRFRECFAGGRFAHRWSSLAIDSRTVSFTNKRQIAKWVADYGEDSDFVRIRVRGLFPRVDAESFIPYELGRTAAAREDTVGHGYRVRLGVDVGRFGNDPSVIYPRCGPDGRSRRIEVYQGLDTMQLAAKIAIAYTTYKAELVFVDEGGVGGGVVDRLRMLRIPVIPVDFGSGAEGTNLDDGAKYANKRAEIWGGMRHWLQRGGVIPERVEGNFSAGMAGDEVTLVQELAAPTYAHNVREEIQLERKTEIKKREGFSPNVADALATTFALPEYADEITASGVTVSEQPTIAPDYDPFAREPERMTS